MNRIATIGFFDGVHRGHQFLFEHLRTMAEERDLTPLIVTFEQHPRAVLDADYQPSLLTSLEERKAQLSKYGEVLVLPFEQIQPLTAAEFMTWLKEEHEVTTLLMGYDHRFGSDRLKRPQDYRRIGEQCGVEVITLSEYVEGEWHVSSTEIRAALENGNIAVANELLGRPYTLRGRVVHGKGIGRTLGFPTANIEPLDALKVIPKAGVYVALINTPLMDDAPAFVNIDRQGIIEAHIPSFKGDLYEQILKLRFVRFLREERHFTSLEDLKNQIKADIDNSLRLEK